LEGSGLGWRILQCPAAYFQKPQVNQAFLFFCSTPIALHGVTKGRQRDGVWQAAFQTALTSDEVAAELPETLGKVYCNYIAQYDDT
jgi:hypothetical protein